MDGVSNRYIHRDFSSSQTEVSRPAGSVLALRPVETRKTLSLEDDLIDALRQWLVPTQGQDQLDLIHLGVQAYLQALFSAEAEPALTEYDLLALPLPESVGMESRLHALLFLADSLRHESEQHKQQLLLRTAFAALDNSGLHELLGGPGAALGRLCEQALSLDLAPDLVKRLIRQHRLVPASLNAPNWPWLIRVYTLGRFALICDGQPVVFNGKSPRKAIDLLQALIAHGGRDIHITLLMQSLWPEENHSNLQNLFDNTLHRLRRILGPVDAVQVRNGKLTLNPELCWVDAWSFNRLTADCMKGQPVCEAWPESDASQAWRLYTGHFLQNEAESAWAWPCRERLRNRFHRLVCALGDRLEQTQRWQEAIKVYERGVEVDNLAEILYQRLMFCYQQLGEHAEALRVFRRCRELLSIVLNVAPSPRTEQLRQLSASPR